jgi:hypothetical protein
LGTKKKNKKKLFTPRHPAEPPKAKDKPMLLSLPIGCMKFFFLKLLVIIFGLG